MKKFIVILIPFIGTQKGENRLYLNKEALFGNSLGTLSARKP